MNFLNYELIFIAYFIDFYFCEFNKYKYFVHPIVIIGSLISFLEKYFYKDSIFRGCILGLIVLIVVYVCIAILSLIENILFQAFLASFCISSKMLYDSVYELINSKNAKEKIALLVSRDTKDMSEEDIYKAGIETYAENFSDGIIAPIFYIFLFGIVGGFLYKTINTLDSMQGYRTKRYEKFGKFCARLDDIINFIPARITAILISVFFMSKIALINFHKFGKKHDSINAGYPISAMALSLNIKLGGPTSYFGTIKDKAYFSQGNSKIIKQNVIEALSLKLKLDFLILFYGMIYLILKS